MPINGSSVLLYCEDVPGSYNMIVIGSQRDCTIDENNALIDTSSKDAREATHLSGRYSSTITLSNLYVPSSTAMAALKAAIRQGVGIKVQKYENGVAVEEAAASVAGRSENFPDQGAAVVSVNITINGAWAAV